MIPAEGWPALAAHQAVPSFLLRPHGESRISQKKTQHLNVLRWGQGDCSPLNTMGKTDSVCGRWIHNRVGQWELKANWEHFPAAPLLPSFNICLNSSIFSLAKSHGSRGERGLWSGCSNFSLLLLSPPALLCPRLAFWSFSHMGCRYWSSWMLSGLQLLPDLLQQPWGTATCSAWSRQAAGVRLLQGTEHLLPLADLGGCRGMLPTFSLSFSLHSCCAVCWSLSSLHTHSSIANAACWLCLEWKWHLGQPLQAPSCPLSPIQHHGSNQYTFLLF